MLTHKKTKRGKHQRAPKVKFYLALAPFSLRYRRHYIKKQCRAKCASLELATKVLTPKQTSKGKLQRPPKVKLYLALAPFSFRYRRDYIKKQCRAKCVSLELATKVLTPKKTKRGKHQRAPKVKFYLALALGHLSLRYRRDYIKEQCRAKCVSLELATKVLTPKQT